jgi:hypothetical protein
LPSRTVCTLIAGLLIAPLAHTQKPAPPQLSPKAAYAEAMHPLEVTRHSIANWSDIEIDALKVTIAHAATECNARTPKDYADEALIDLARLCTLGQRWRAVVESNTLYIAADTPAKPLLNQAYGSRINAELHLKQEPAALADCLTMLKVVPYDALSAEVIDEAIEYMQFVHTADALTLDAAREPFVLANIATPQSAVNPDPSATPPQTLHDLYGTGLAFAALQQLADQLDAAAATVTQLDAALPATLTPDDAIPIADARKRYAFLGKPLPAIAMLDSLSMPNKLPQLPAPGAITALLLFPDWCVQCVRMGKQFPTSVFIVEGHEAYAYGLMAEVAPAMPKPPPSKDAPPPKPTPREILAETPTVVVSPAVLTQFAASDFPFLILADAQGIIRVIQPVAEDVLQQGGTLDSAIAVVAANWALKPATPAAAPKPSAPSP